MKSSIAFLLATVVLTVQGSTLEVRRNNGGHNGSNHRGGSGNNNNNNNGGASASTTAVTATASTAANTSSGNSGGNSGNNGGGNNSTNPQDSLTLDPSVICTACTNDGQSPPVAGQSPSLTSSNNFINFCQGKTLTDGQQLVNGSCNGVVYGNIIPSTNMPAAKISFPPNGGTFPANQNFTFTMNIQNLITGNFVNANTNYYGAPQQLQNNVVVGHSHVTVQTLSAIDSTDPLDPETFAFFKGINTPAQNGVLSVPVVGGLPAGVYRFCSINTDANHTPALVAIAQHGSLDDCIYATAVDNGGNNSTASSTDSAGASSTDSAGASATDSNGASTGANGSSTDSAGASTDASGASSTTAAPAAASSSPARGGGHHGKGKGRGRGGRGRHPH